MSEQHTEDRPCECGCGATVVWRVTLPPTRGDAS